MKLYNKCLQISFINNFFTLKKGRKKEKESQAQKFTSYSNSFSLSLSPLKTLKTLTLTQPKPTKQKLWKKSAEPRSSVEAEDRIWEEEEAHVDFNKPLIKIKIKKPMSLLRL